MIDESYGYEASIRRFVKILILVALAYFIATRASIVGRYVGMLEYQHMADNDVAVADQYVDWYESHILYG